MIKFNEIKNWNIFAHDFCTLISNNKISFSSEGIAVIYGPNGIGKSSLANVLSGNEGTKIEFEFDGQLHTSVQDIFHISLTKDRVIQAVVSFYRRGEDGG